MASILSVRGLTKDFYIADSYFSKVRLRAVDDVSFNVEKGTAVGLVGESGCGKSTVARCVVRLIEPTSGQVFFDDSDILKVPVPKLRTIRKRLQMVFQDPSDSLNPRMTVRQVLTEPLMLHADLPPAARVEQAVNLLSQVGLKREHMDRFPHQLSGGQQQRVGIARALATGAELLVLDEPTSALDTSVRGQILLLLSKLQADLGLSYVFISHDLSVVHSLCRTVIVMYLGQVVEMGPVAEVFSSPLHPYTRALLSAVPVPDPKVKGERIRLVGEIPSPINLPPGCRMTSRCSYADDYCRAHRPGLIEIGQGRSVACWKAGGPDQAAETAS